MNPSEPFFFTDAEAAQFLRQSLVTNWRYRKARIIDSKPLSQRTTDECLFLEDWKVKHKCVDYRGPKFQRRGRRVFYLKPDLVEWLMGRTALDQETFDHATNPERRHG